MALDDTDERSAYPSDGEPNESAPGVTDTDDGGAIVQTGEEHEDEPPADEDNFYANLVPHLDPTKLSNGYQYILLSSNRKSFSKILKSISYGIAYVHRPPSHS